MNPAMLEDRSGLFNEIGSFSQRKLKKVETKVCTGTGETVVEKRNAKGLQTVNPSNKSSSSAASNEPARKLDLQVGLVAPGIMIGSHDVAHHKQTLEEYGITHILNLASEEVENLFEDELNYVSIQIDDCQSTQLEKFYDEAFDCLDDGRQRGNCLIHCNASKPGLSRSTTICIAYLMTKDKKRLTDAFNDVKEARSFVRPSDHFMKQLQKLDSELFGSKKKDDIEDAFTKKKRQEIEAEKQMLKSQAVKLKDRAKLFVESVTPERSQSPNVNSGSPIPGSVAKKWQPINGTNDDGRRKSFVPDYVTNETNGRSDSIDSQTGAPRKLTSIISLFSKPKDENSNTIVSDEHRPSFSLNTAPAKKWKTVEPPPRPGFLKKNKSRRFLTNSDSIKRIKSKGNFEETVKRTKSKEFKAAKQSSLNQSQDGCIVENRNKGAAAPQVNGTTVKRQTSRQDSVTKKTAVPTPPPPPPPPLVSKNGPPPPPQVSKSVPPPPPPAPLKSSLVKPPSLKAAPPPPPPPPPPQQSDDPTPWRRSNSRTPEPKPLPIQTQISIDSEYRMKPDETRYKTSFSVNPARRGSKTEPEPEKKTAPVVQKNTPPPPPAPKLPDVVPPQQPVNKTVFGKVKPPQMKLVGSTLSTDSNKGSCQPKPEPIKEVPKVQPAPPVKKQPSYQKSISVDEDDEDEQEEEEEEEETDEDEGDDEDGYTQIYDHQNNSDHRGSDSSYHDSRRVSEVKGLNRSSTTEILKLIKSKTGADLTQNLDTLDEDEENGEIDALLEGLEEEGIDNIDWGELGIDVVEVKSIVNKHENDEEEGESEEEEEDEEVETEEEEEVECHVVPPTTKYGLRAK